MSYYNICPDCGARLDPGERCDCKDRAPGSDPNEAETWQSTKKNGAPTGQS